MATKTLTPEDFVTALKEWTVLDVVNAVKLMEDELGIKAAAPVAVAAAPAAGGGETAAAEQTEFTVILTAAGDAKINVIKAVREVTGTWTERGQGLGQLGSQGHQGSDPQGRSRNHQGQA